MVLRNKDILRSSVPWLAIYLWSFGCIYSSN
nr:MAG TPA: hypothetical protein [Crassvirales sp.]DAO83133.1 MAG TPA: hypothetical protein [Bacteriophage sp.]